MLKAKYCSRVAAVSCTQNTQKPMWPWRLSMTLEFSRVLEIIDVHVYAKFHQAKCIGSSVLTNFLPYVTMVRNPKIRSCDLDLGPMTLKFNGVCAVVKVHVRAKFHQVKCSGSWVIVVSGNKEKKQKKTLQRCSKNYTVVDTTDSNRNLCYIKCFCFLLSFVSKSGRVSEKETVACWLTNQYFSKFIHSVTHSYLIVWSWQNATSFMYTSLFINHQDSIDNK